MNEVQRRIWIPLMTCVENERLKRRHMAIPAACQIAKSLKESKRRKMFLLLYAGGSLGLKRTRTVVGFVRGMSAERDEICHIRATDMLAYTRLGLNQQRCIMTRPGSSDR